MVQMQGAEYQHRSHLFGLAYRMLGSRAAAEDAVQTAYVRYAEREVAPDSPRAYLTKIVTNVCLDTLKSAREQREVYVGPWLPEPMIGMETPFGDPLERAESLSMGLLFVLERLSPLERAAYVLHELLEFSHEEIARFVERAPEAVRQLVHRARIHLEQDRSRFVVSEQAHVEMVQAFAMACASGDLAALQAILHRDVVTLSDGGGNVNAALKPIVGPDRVARFLLGIVHKIAAGLVPTFVHVNGALGIVLVEGEHCQSVVSLEGMNGVITRIYIVVNPEKLRLVRV